MIYALFPDTPANEAEYALSKGTAQNILLAETVENNMFAICDATGLFQGTTATEVIDALVANDKLSTTDPVDVTIGGLSGRQIDVQLSPDWSGSCPLGPDDPPTRDYKDARNRIILLDTPDGGSIGLAVSSLYSSQFRHSSPRRCRSSTASGSASDPRRRLPEPAERGSLARGSRASPVRARSPRTAP